jgi:hypothetical protein
MVKENALLAVPGSLYAPAIVLKSPVLARHRLHLVPNALLPAIAL